MATFIALSSDGKIQIRRFESTAEARSSASTVLESGTAALVVLEEEGSSTYALLEGGSVSFLGSEFLKRFVPDSLSEFEELKRLLESDEWPKAVLDLQIADDNSEEEKDERAEGIVDIILPPLKGKRLLDFGCGEGHVAAYASRHASLSVGYDIVRSPRSRFSWDESCPMLTTDFDRVKASGPYDFVLLYDVMDHLKNDTPKDVLSMASSVLADGGKIYIRNHPWTSRHGGHAYRHINKAFVHLVFSESELKSLGLDLEPVSKIMTPQGTYKSWIEESGLKNCEEPILDRDQVESFFRDNPNVRRRILNAFRINEWTEGLPEWQMSQSFWDYVLGR